LRRWGPHQPEVGKHPKKNKNSGSVTKFPIWGKLKKNGRQVYLFTVERGSVATVLSRAKPFEKNLPLRRGGVQKRKKYSPSRETGGDENPGST